MTSPTDPIVQEIARQLQETEINPKRSTAAIVRVCGEDFARDILRQTLEIEAQGGLSAADGSCRRTIGGVYLYLAKQQMSSEARKQVFPTQIDIKRRRNAQHRRRIQAQLATVMTEDELREYKKLKAVAANHNRKISRGEIPPGDLEAAYAKLADAQRRTNAIEKKYRHIFEPAKGKKRDSQTRSK